MADPERRDFRLVPVAAAAWAAAWLGTSGVVAAVVAAAAVGTIVLAAAGVWRRALVAATAITLLTILGLAGLRHHQLIASPVAAWAQDKALVEVEFTVRVDPKVSHGSRFGSQQTRAIVEVRRVSGRGQTFELRQQLLVTASGDNGEVLRRRLLLVQQRSSPRRSARSARRRNQAERARRGWLHRSAEDVVHGLVGSLGVRDGPRIRSARVPMTALMAHTPGPGRWRAHLWAE